MAGEPTQALLSYLAGEENRTDTATLAEDIFTFTGTVDEPTLATLYVNFPTEEGARPQIYHTQLVLEPGVVTVTVPEQWADATITGTITNDEMKRWNDTIRPIQDQMHEMQVWFGGLTPEEQAEKAEESQNKYAALGEQIRTIGKEYVVANPDSWFALNALFNYMFEGQDPEAAQAALDGFTESLRATITPSGLRRKFAGMLRTEYSCATSLPQPLRSESCVQSSLSSATALSHASLLLSSDMPRTV